eukprot:gene4171-4085_t
MKILVIEDERLDLTAKEFLLLSLFLRRQGQVLSRTAIAEQVWDMNFDSDTNVVEVAIRRLRTKMDLPFEKPLLHTVRGMGYPSRHTLAPRAHSLRARLSLWLAVQSLVGLGAVCLVVYLVIALNQTARQDEALAQKE